MEFFTRMGEQIEELWREHNFDERAFPQLAATALRQRPPAQNITYAEAIDALLFGRAMPEQPQEQSFGQPPIVVFRHPRFYIEVLCWMDSTTTIHQHAFSGAFHVMAGSSVHSSYAFSCHDRINQHFLIGGLRFVGCELLEAGDTRAIVAGSDCIHALFHLDRPSISVVVRTRVESDVGPQYNYFPPHVALNPFDKNPIDAQRDQLMRMLVETDRESFLRVAGKTMTHCDLATVFRTLRHAYLATVTPPYRLHADDVATLCHLAGERFGPAIDPLTRTIERTTQIDEIARRRTEVTDPDLRFFLALLMNVPNRRAIDELIASRYAGEPRARINAWLAELTQYTPEGTVCLLDIELDGAVEGDEPSGDNSVASVLESTLEHMLDGARGPELLESLCDAFPSGFFDDIAEAIEALEMKVLQGALRPLFVDAQGAR